MLSKIYTPKQIEILKACRNSDWFMLINHGAKRSGKTQLDNDLFLAELRKVRQMADQLGIDTPQYILAGYSLGNIQDNILTELSNKYGFEFKFDKYNNFNLFGVKVVQTSHGSISGLGRIRGMTASTRRRLPIRKSSMKSRQDAAVRVQGSSQIPTRIIRSTGY